MDKQLSLEKKVASTMAILLTMGMFSATVGSAAARKIPFAPAANAGAPVPVMDGPIDSDKLEAFLEDLLARARSSQ